MFWEVNRRGALILPGAKGLLFISRRSRRCGAANQIRAERLRNFPDELALENLRQRKYAAAVSRDAPDRITKADEEYPFPSPSARKNPSFSLSLRARTEYCYWMAGVWRRPESQYWTVCVRDEKGRQRRITTKETNSKKTLKIAEEFESAVRTKRTLEQVQKVLDRVESIWSFYHHRRTNPPRWYTDTPKSI